MNEADAPGDARARGARDGATALGLARERRGQQRRPGTGLHPPVLSASCTRTTMPG